MYVMQKGETTRIPVLGELLDSGWIGHQQSVKTHTHGAIKGQQHTAEQPIFLCSQAAD